MDLPFLLGPRAGSRSPSSACGTTRTTNKVVGTLFNTAQDDKSWHDAFIPAIKKAGFTVVDPGQFPAFGNDFTPQVGAFKEANVEIVTGNLFTPDFAGFYNQCAQQGYQPKVITLGKAFLFPSDVEALGPAGVGVTSEVWWTPDHPYTSSLTGIIADLSPPGTRRIPASIGRSRLPSSTLCSRSCWDVLETAIDRRSREAILDAITKTDIQHDRRPGEVDGQSGKERLHHAGGGRPVAEEGRPP